MGEESARESDFSCPKSVCCGRIVIIILILLILLILLIIIMGEEGEE